MPDDAPVAPTWGMRASHFSSKSIDFAGKAGSTYRVKSRILVQHLLDRAGDQQHSSRRRRGRPPRRRRPSRTPRSAATPHGSDRRPPVGWVPRRRSTPCGPPQSSAEPGNPWRRRRHVPAVLSCRCPPRPARTNRTLRPAHGHPREARGCRPVLPPSRAAQLQHIYSGEAPRRCSKISDVCVPATSASALRFSTTNDRRSSVSRAATCRMKSSAPARK